MNITHYSPREGADWIKFPSNVRIPGAHSAIFIDDGLAVDVISLRILVEDLRSALTLHSIKTSDGREWDTINGWRN